MTATPELQTAQNMTSAEYLADRVIKAYQSLNSEDLFDVGALYAPDVYFEDPTHGIQGKAALMKYFTKMFRNLRDCEFKFHQTISNGTDIFLSWTMLLSHPSIKKGETIRIEGASYLKTRNGKNYYHRDYFDMGAMLYEHLPVMGRVIHHLKERLVR